MNATSNQQTASERDAEFVAAGGQIFDRAASYTNKIAGEIVGNIEPLLQWRSIHTVCGWSFGPLLYGPIEIKTPISDGVPPMVCINNAEFVSDSGRTYELGPIVATLLRIEGKHAVYAVEHQ